MKGVTIGVWFGGVYQDERNFFPQYCIDKETYRAMYPEFKVPEGEWQAFLADREGCVVGRGTAQKFGFKVGDRVPLRAPIWGGTWEFNVRGIYDGARAEDDVTAMWLRYDYWEERTPFGKGLVGWYVVRVANPDLAPAVVETIDRRFENSPWETRRTRRRPSPRGS